MCVARVPGNGAYLNAGRFHALSDTALSDETA